MKVKVIFTILSFILIILMFVYWFIPIGNFEFNQIKNSNFSIDEISEMQFYKNMRFPSKEISYSINEECSLKKKNEMSRAFSELSNLTVLNFFLDKNASILVFCDEREKFEGRLFVAGEGGPTSVLEGDNFNIINSGKILLLKENLCERPNVPVHELLHVLGFNHSNNPENIMYPVSKCLQTVGDDLINKINELYSYPEYPDLKLKNVSLKLNGKYLDLKISIFNMGLKESKKTKLLIYNDENLIKEIEIDKIEVSNGITLYLENFWVPNLKIEKIKLIINNSTNELSLENNEIYFEKT